MSIWAQVTSIPNGTRIFNYGYDQCVALANHWHAMLGGSFVPVQSAYQWWSNSYAQVDAIYTRSAVPVAGGLFVARYGIYNAPDGHIGIVTKVHANGTFDTMEQNAGTWRYVGRYTRGMANMLGFLVPRNNPANVPLEPTQRKVGANPVKRRAAATTQSAEKQPPLDPHGVANFNGWVYGERVNDGIVDTNVWFRGISGDMFWSGGFTSQSVDGLTNLNPVVPPAIAANQRQVDPVPVHIRKLATANSEIVGSLAANAIVTPEGWVRGQSVSGIDVWVKIQGGHAWLGGFTREDTAGLVDLNTASPVPAPIDPPLPTDPTGPNSDLGHPGSVLAAIDQWSLSAPTFEDYEPLTRFEPASVGIEFPDWIKFEKIPVTGGFYEGRPGKPNHFGLHHAASPHFDGAKDTLDGPGVPTTHYLVKDGRVGIMVDTRDNASTNGRYRSNQFAINFEVCNDKTTTDKPSAMSHEAVAWVMADEALKWGYKLPLAMNETALEHKVLSKSPTACPGDLDIAWIANRSNEIITASQSQEEPPAPDYSGLEEKIDKLTSMTQWIVDLLKRIFKGAA
ncbi:MAG: CHAP domain-containing protein [Hyphomicrobium sp.]